MIDPVLMRARERIRRYEPGEAAHAMTCGALLVDTRPVEQRTRDGAIPGAVVIDRNVLEWRLDVDGAHCIPEMTSREREVVIICNQGYSSSLAAATLVEMGLRSCGDVVGGFEAWRAAGLPVVPLATEPRL